MSVRSTLYMPACVYKLVCRPTGKEYIGATVVSLDERMKQHVAEAKAERFDTVLYRAMRFHGADCFTIELLTLAPSGLEAQRLERLLIAEHRTLVPNGLNTSTGGESWAGIRRTEEVRQKISKAKLGRRIWSDEARAAMSVERKGRKRSEADRAAMRAGQADPEVKRRKSEQLKARWDDPAFREVATAASKRANEARRGVPRTPESIALMKANRKCTKGTKWTEERRARMKPHDPAMMGAMSKKFWDENPQEKERRRVKVSAMNRMYGCMVSDATAGMGEV